MKSNYKKLGGYIRQLDLRNSDASLGEDNLYGISVTKEFIISHANLVGVTFDSYKVVAPRQFAYIPDTSRRGDKIAISLNTFGEDIIVSSICSVFEIIDENQLLPEYLMLWFMRPEFDRYARFMSNGSAREVFDWDCMCGVELPVPSISEQRKIVHDYKVITDRIDLLRKMNENLENQGIALLQDKVINSDRIVSVDNMVNLFDSMRKPVSGADRVNLAKIYPYYGAAALMDYIDEYIFDGIYGLIAEDGSVMDDDGHPTMQYVWGKFWVNNHAHIFQGKNGFSTETVYLLLKTAVIRDIVTGAVQLKVNQENLRNFKISVPEEEYMDDIESAIQPLFSLIRTNTDEIERLSKLAELRLATIAKGA